MKKEEKTKRNIHKTKATVQHFNSSTLTPVGLDTIGNVGGGVVNSTGHPRLPSVENILEYLKDKKQKINNIINKKKKRKRRECKKKT